MVGFSLLRKLREGTNVTQVAWSPDGSKLATASHYSDARIWNTETWQAKILQGSLWTHSIAWSPDSKRLVTGTFPERTAFWNVESGEQLSSMVHIAPVRDMLFCSTSHLVTTADDQILVWNVTDSGIVGPSPARIIIGHREVVRCLALHPEGRIMASGSDDGDVRIWECNSWKCLSILGGHAKRVLALTWSNDGSLLASGSIDSTIRIWDSSFRTIRILEGHTGPVRALSFSHDRRLLASKSDDQTVRIWRCDDWENLENIPERSMIGNLAFHPQSPLLATQDDASEHVMVRVWQVQISDLLERAPFITVASYTNAKIVLVGDTGVGKSGLALALTGQPFKPTESTHGRRVWIMDRSALLGGKETREVLLWDLAGQTGYRLVHQLHLTEVAVAIVIFDSRSETDPFAGVRYWDRALLQGHRIQGGTFPPPKKFLVAARTDRGGVAASRNRIHRCGFGI